jgi:hypothetical protein
MSTGADVGAVVLVRTTRGRADIVRALGAIDGVSGVEPVRGPYDLVIHAAGPAQVEIIEQFPGVAAAEVCWLCPRSQGGIG